jgi:alpha-glucoside transport system substrate-binding protein
VDYPNDVMRNAGNLLTNAKYFVFDASDNMPTAMQTEFYKDLLAYVQNPSQLDSLLADLDSVQSSAYSS